MQLALIGSHSSVKLQSSMHVSTICMRKGR